MIKDKFILAVGGITLFLIVAGAFLVTRVDKNGQVEANPNVEVLAAKTSHNWGDIGISDGNVEAEFEVKNEGKESLKLSDVTTSCMCTTARLILGDEISPTFGMHTKSNYVMEIPAGESAKLKVIFDPAYHGPSGVGPITRQVTISTNDPDKPELNYMLTANVTKQK